MRILHVAAECHAGRFAGGISKVVFELAVNQSLDGHKVAVFSLASLDNFSVHDGVEFQTFSKYSGSEIIAAIRLFIHLVRGAKYDVIHSHNTFHVLNLLVLLAAKLCGTKVFYHPHGALDPELVSSWSINQIKKRVYIYLVEAPVLSSANAVFVLSDYEEESVSHWGVSAPLYIVPNGISTPHVAATTSSDLSLLFIGRINPKKNLEDVIKALAILHSRGFSCRLRIVGDESKYPSYVRSLRELVRCLDVGDYVLWEGFKDENGKVPYLESGDVFVHSSHSEGMAMAVLEAMAHGLPVLVSDGCHMSRAAEAGALVNYGHGHVQLAEQLCKLFSADYSMRSALGQKGRRYVISEHSWPSCSRKITRYYA